LLASKQGKKRFETHLFPSLVVVNEQEQRSASTSKLMQKIGFEELSSRYCGFKVKNAWKILTMPLSSIV
jgi:hypothetical protein